MRSLNASTQIHYSFKAAHITIPMLLLSLGACSGLPNRGKSRGIVTLGQPEVHMRERHIADRFADIEWLRDRLSTENMAKFEQGIQGSKLSVVNDAIGIALKATLSPEVPEGDDSQSSDPGGEDETLTNASSNGNSQSGGANGEDDEKTKDPDEGKTTRKSIDEVIDLIEYLNLTQAMKPTPIEGLDDMLAYRDTVRSEIRQRSLDDVHDAVGSTLYELTFDLSYLSGEDSGSPVLVVCDMAQEQAANTSEFDEFAKQVDRLVERLAYIELERRYKRISSRTESVEDYWKSGVVEEARKRSERFAKNYTEEITRHYLIKRRAEVFDNEHGLGKKQNGEDKSSSISKFVVSDTKLNADILMLNTESLRTDHKGVEYLKSADRQFESRFTSNPVVAEFIEKMNHGSVEERVRLVGIYSRRIQSEIERIAFSTITKSDVALAFQNEVGDENGGSQWPVLIHVTQATGLKPTGIKIESLHDVIRNRLCKIQKNHSRVVDVSPRELNERLSMSHRSLVSRTLSLAASGDVSTGVNAGANFDSLREQLLTINTIEGNPVLIGFSHAPGFSVNSSSSESNESEGKKNSFGWLIGPSYEARQPSFGGVEDWYRHPGMSQSVTATVIVPAHLREIKLDLRAYRLKSDGRMEELQTYKPDSNEGSSNSEFTIRLPKDPMSAARSVVYGPQYVRPAPMIIPPERKDANKPTWTLRAEEPGYLVLRGENAWRNPRVFLHGKPATRVEILPGLDGIQAHWDKVPVPASKDPEGFRADLVVASSRGQDTLAESVLILPKNRKASLPDLTATVPQTVVNTHASELRLPIKLGAKPGTGLSVEVSVHDESSTSSGDIVFSGPMSDFGSRYFDSSSKILDVRLPIVISPDSVHKYFVTAELKNLDGSTKKILDNKVLVFGSTAATLSASNGTYVYDSSKDKLLSGEFRVTWSAGISVDDLRKLYPNMDGASIRTVDGRPLDIEKKDGWTDNAGVPEYRFYLKGQSLKDPGGSGNLNIEVTINKKAYKATLTR